MIKHLKPPLLRGASAPSREVPCSAASALSGPPASPRHTEQQITHGHTELATHNNQQHLVVRWPTDGLLGSFFPKGFLCVNN